MLVFRTQLGTLFASMLCFCMVGMGVVHGQKKNSKKAGGIQAFDSGGTPIGLPTIKVDPKVPVPKVLGQSKRRRPLFAPGVALTYTVKSYDDKWWLFGPRGRRLISLSPVFNIAVRDVKLGEPVEDEPEITGAKGWRIFARFTQQDRRGNPIVNYVYSVSSGPSGPSIKIKWDLEYQRDVWIEEESLTFRTAAVGGAQALDRAYRLTPVGSTMVMGPLTPHFVGFGHGYDRVSLLDHPSVQSVQVQPAKQGSHRLHVEFEHVKNHPFERYRACFKKVRSSNAKGKKDMSWSRRRRGEKRSYEFTFAAGRIIPVVPSRFPFPYRSALSFTDHADQSNHAKLEALVFGRTNALDFGEVRPKGALGGASDQTYRGLVNRGLGFSKTIFMKQARRHDPQFENPDYRELLEAMERRGVEIGLHSVTGGPDSSKDVKTLLRSFTGAFSGRTWIDHQPDTNCEAIANQGAQEKISKYYLLDHFADLNFRTLWAVKDVANPAVSLNMLRPGKPQRRQPVFYGFPRFGENVTLFRSQWMFSSLTRFIGLFKAKKLDRLAREWGISIGHVYLDTAEPTSKKLLSRSLLERTGENQYVLREEADALFKRLAVRQNKWKALWVTGIEALATHTQAAMSLSPRYLPDGRIIVDPPLGPLGSRPRTFGLLVPNAVSRIEIDGRPAKISRQTRYVDNWQLVELPFGKPGRKTIRFFQNGRPMPAIRSAKVLLQH